MRHKRYIFLFILTVSVSLLVIGCVYNVISGKPWYANIMVQFFLNLPLCIGLGFIDFGVINLIYKRLKQRNNAVRILVVSVFLRFLSLATFCKPTICKILFRETNPGRDKNGTKPQENKIKNASSPASLVMDFSFLCKGTILSREKQAISYKYVVNQPFISHGHFQEDTANASHTDLCCLFQRSVKICFMPFVHYGISAVAHCLGQMYNPPAIISNAECVSNQ